MRRVETETWPAPIRGWWQSDNVANSPRDAAEVLDNWFPQPEGVRVRRGCTAYADLGAAVKRLLPYAGGGTEDLLASTTTSVFDADRIAGGGLNTFAEWEGLASGDWSTAQMSTAGGDFMIAVNGSDHGWFWDGSEVNPLSSVAVTNLEFDAMSAAFEVGETVTGGTSGASAEILGISRTSATAGTLKIGTITSGPFQDNETITDGATGSATSDIPSGTSSATGITVTGIATASLSQVWTHAQRPFFVEKDTLSFWYLPVESVGGALTEYPMYGIFNDGGKILFGTSWSMDSGDGMNNLCVVVSDQGEAAVFQGLNPTSISTWAIVGVYRIGTPLNKHCWFRSGGDLIIATEAGLISMTDVLNKPASQVQAMALTYPIEDEWGDAVARDRTHPFAPVLWDTESKLYISVPDLNDGRSAVFVANSQTRAWCRYTGWDMQCGGVSADIMYFGASNGKIYKAENGGDDDGASYTAVCVPKFLALGVDRKFLLRAHYITRAPIAPIIRIRGLGDYKVPALTVPPATPAAGSDVWGTGVWGTFTWGSNDYSVTHSKWSKITGNGFAISIAAQVTSLNTLACDVELLALRVRYERGSPI